MIFVMFYSTNFLKELVQEGEPGRIYGGVTKWVFYCNSINSIYLITEKAGDESI